MVAVEFSADYVNITLPYEMEDRLPLMLTQLNVRALNECGLYICLRTNIIFGAE